MTKQNLLINDYYNYINSSIDLLIELSYKGDTGAMYIGAIRILKEHEITNESIKTRPIKQALTLLEKATKAQHIDSMFQLIYVYEEIINVCTNQHMRNEYISKRSRCVRQTEAFIKYINQQFKNTLDFVDPYSVRFPKPKQPNDVSLVEGNDISTFTLNLNEYCKELQDLDKEVVSEEVMLKAKKIVDNLIPDNIYDVLLYCAALNVLNTFVKQKQNQITYYFKNNVVDVLLKSIVNNNIKDVNYVIKMDGNINICYVKLHNIIFSFHQVVVKENDKDLIYNSVNYKDVDFDDVRKQMCSVSIFINVLNYLKIN